MRTAVVVAVASGCYAPVPPAGVPCTPGGTPCPEPQVCAPAGGGFECTSDPSSIDSGVDTVVPVPPGACSNQGLACNGGMAIAACDGACWVSCEDVVTYATAVARCAAWGGRVTPLRTEADLACFANAQLDQVMWLGLEQQANQAKPGEGWSWNGDGLAPAFFRWEAGQPEDSDGLENDTEDCAAVRPNDVWFDRDCPGAAAFACRR